MFIPRGHKQTDEEYHKSCMGIYRATTPLLMVATIGLMLWGVFILIT